RDLTHFEPDDRACPGDHLTDLFNRGRTDLARRFDRAACGRRGNRFGVEPELLGRGDRAFHGALCCGVSAYGVSVTTASRSPRKVGSTSPYRFFSLLDSCRLRAAYTPGR